MCTAAKYAQLSEGHNGTGSADRHALAVASTTINSLSFERSGRLAGIAQLCLHILCHTNAAAAHGYHRPCTGTAMASFNTAQRSADRLS